jgi:hypothetical protein
MYVHRGRLEVTWHLGTSQVMGLVSTKRVKSWSQEYGCGTFGFGARDRTVVGHHTNRKEQVKKECLLETQTGVHTQLTLRLNLFCVALRHQRKVYATQRNAHFKRA